MLSPEILTVSGASGVKRLGRDACIVRILGLSYEIGIAMNWRTHIIRICEIGGLIYDGAG